MNKYRKALDEMYSLTLNNSDEIYGNRSMYLQEKYDLLEELIEKTEFNIHREIKLLHFLNDLIPNCRIFRGYEVGYIIVDNYKEHRGLGSIICCLYTYRVIREKNVNFMTPSEIIAEFYQRGWLDVD